MGFSFIFFVFLAILSTLAGAFFALRFKSHLRPIIGFSAGMLIAVAFFDLMPESFELLGNFELLPIGVIAGFLFYLVLERFILFHACHEPEEGHFHFHTGTLGLLGLTLHRAMDGFVIGISFQSSEALGILVSLAIISHSFPDGVNAVVLMLSKNKLEFSKWVFLLAAAILGGSLISQFVIIPEKTLGILVGFVAGWFLYLGASDLLPEAHREHADLKPLITTLFGIALIYAVSVFLGA